MREKKLPERGERGEARGGPQWALARNRFGAKSWLSTTTLHGGRIGGRCAASRSRVGGGLGCRSLVGLSGLGGGFCGEHRQARLDPPVAPCSSAPGLSTICQQCHLHIGPTSRAAVCARRVRRWAPASPPACGRRENRVATHLSRAATRKSMSPVSCSIHVFG